MRDAWQFLLQMLKPMRYRIILGALLVALTVFGNVGLLATSGVLLTRAALKPELLLLMPLITGVRFFGTGRAAVRYAERLYNHSLAFRILTGLREALYKRLEPLVPDLIQGYSEGQLYNRLIGDVEVLKYFYLRVVSLPVGTILVILGTSIFTSLYVLPAGILLACDLLVSFCLIPLLSVRSQIKIDHKRRQSRDELSNTFTDIFHGLFEWQTSDFGDHLEDRVNQLSHADLQAQRQGVWVERLAIHGLAFLAHGTALGVLVLTAPAVRAGDLSIWVLPMLTLVAMASFETLNQLPQALRECWMSLEAAKELADIRPSRPLPPAGDQLPASLDIQVEGVGFSYHQLEGEALKDIHLEIPHGRHVAFVGTSGSGKTSLARLLLRLWRPDRGEVRLGGLPLDQVEESFLRDTIGYLEQTPAFFNTSIRDNLRLAKPEAEDPELMEVLKAVQLDQVVAAWPEGLDTSILENGTRLSGGERQRLALARVILQNPDIVILDEPLHNLDGLTSQMLDAFLDQWAADKTVILITHELKTLPFVDFIYLFQHGKICASGPHSTLLAESEYYQNLWRLEQERI
ncbi:thiol reductant ABC exporter subunit CydC [Peptococcus simiae]|uniref:Thiol reductant ABC exporter subunit CydC n=1 Tax=Peptococcus simiae TaxID=1643805 RepID=A0ABW9GXR8_9FIRM